MRVLLDECVSEGLRNYLSEHECQTARYAGFAGLENGQLLTAAEAAKFEVLLGASRPGCRLVFCNKPQIRCGKGLFGHCPRCAACIRRYSVSRLLPDAKTETLPRLAG